MNPTHKKIAEAINIKKNFVVLTGKEIHSNVELANISSTGTAIMTAQHKFISLSDLIIVINKISNILEEEDKKTAYKYKLQNQTRYTAPFNPTEFKKLAGG